MPQSAVGAFQAGLRERPQNLDFSVGGAGSRWTRAVRQRIWRRSEARSLPHPASLLPYATAVCS